MFNTDRIKKDVAIVADTPDAQKLVTDESFLSLANHQLYSTLVPFILEHRAEFLTTSFTIPAYTTSYQMPKDVIGSKLRDMYVDYGSWRRSIPYKLREEIASYMDYGVLIDNDKILINRALEQPLNISYFKRPNELVLSKDSSKVSAIDETQTSLTFSGQLQLKVNTRYDIINVNSPHSVKGSILFTNVNGSMATFDKPTFNIVENDIICLEGYSTFIPLPDDFVPLFEQMIATKIMEMLKDQNGFQLAMTKLEEIKRLASMMITPKVDGSPKKIFKKNNVALWY